MITMHILSALSQTEEPKNYEMEKLDLRWHKAVNEELHVLEKKSKLGNIRATKK
jgi:hypothetical protein